MSQAFDSTTNNNSLQDQPPSHHIHGSSEALPAAGKPDQTAQLYDPNNSSANPGSANLNEGQQQNTGDVNKQGSDQYPRPTGAFPGGHANSGELNKQGSDQYPRPTGAFPGGHSGQQVPQSENVTDKGINNTTGAETSPNNTGTTQNEESTGSFHHGRHHPPTTGVIGTNTGANETNTGANGTNTGINGTNTGANDNQLDGERDTSSHTHHHHHAAEAALAAGGVGAAGTAYGTNNTDKATGEPDVARAEHHHHHHHDGNKEQRDRDRTPDQSLDNDASRRHQATGATSAALASDDKELKHGGPGHRHAHHGHPQEENRAFSSAKDDHNEGRDVTQAGQTGPTGSEGRTGVSDDRNALTNDQPAGVQPTSEGGAGQGDLPEGKASFMDKMIGKTQKVIGKVKGDQDMRETGELRQTGGKAAVQGLASPPQN